MAKEKAKKKKHQLKKDEPLPFIEGDFDIVSCDLSMQCPGFAILHYEASARSVTIKRKDQVDNIGVKNKPHGKILNEIGSKLSDFLAGNTIKVVVRERAFSRFNAEVQTINKVVGVAEMITYHILEAKFQELTPASVKKNVTGSGRASKEEVAEAVENYFDEPITWASDNESDAVAVGIAWLVANGYLDLIPLEKYSENAQDLEEEEEDV